MSNVALAKAELAIKPKIYTEEQKRLAREERERRKIIQAREDEEESIREHFSGLGYRGKDFQAKIKYYLDKYDQREAEEAKKQAEIKAKKQAEEAEAMKTNTVMISKKVLKEAEERFRQREKERLEAKAEFKKENPEPTEQQVKDEWGWPDDNITNAYLLWNTDDKKWNWYWPERGWTDFGNNYYLMRRWPDYQDFVALEEQVSRTDIIRPLDIDPPRK